MDDRLDALSLGRILDLIDQYWPPLMSLAAALIDDAVACGMLVAS
jgi:hypothetical protein